MEPTIRKGEQSREENYQPEHDLTWDDVEEEFQEQLRDAPVADESDQTQTGVHDWPPFDAGAVQTDEFPEVENSDVQEAAQTETNESIGEWRPPQTIDDADAEPTQDEELIVNAPLAQPIIAEEFTPAESVEPTLHEYPAQTPIEQPGSADEQVITPELQSGLRANEVVTDTTLEPATAGPSEIASQFTTEFLPLPAFEEVQAAPLPRKVALILSGGGARGAFQVGAEKYAREVKGYQWDIIAGVSVGAMNGAMLAMHRFARLLELWDHISDSQVYTGGFNLISLVKILFGDKSFYGNEPLIKLMQREFEAGQVIDDLHVGAVSLISGEYVQFTRQSLELSKAILASASIPVVWPPVDVSPDHPAMVDGGVCNITPVGDVLELEPDEIVIINCSNEMPPVMPNAPSNVLSIGMRALDIMQNEIFVNDMKEFLRINELVKEARDQGTVLHHPKSGRPFKYYPCHVIEPDVELGGVLDFSQKSIQAALKAGVRRAREVLGRP